MIKLLTVVAAAAMGLTSCQNGFEEQVGANVKKSVTVSFVSEEARTAVDTSGATPLFSWNENETFAVLEQTDALAVATSVVYNKVDGKATIDAEFAVNAGKGAYNYITVYPASGYVSAESINAATLALPAEQSMAEGSYDPNADLMVSWPVTTTAQPTEAQQLRFTRLAAVAEMAISNLPEGETIEKVVFTANGKALAGTINADLENPHAFSVKEGVSTVSVASASSGKVLFTVLPTTLAAGDSYNVVVLTNNHLYVKESVIPAEKSLVFEAGKVSRFGVNLSGITPSEKWVLVRDASTLAEGDIVTIAAKNNNFVLGCNISTNFPYASYTNIVKSGDYLYHPVVTDKSKSSYMVQQLVLSKQDAGKAAFDFYNGVDYEGDTKSGYLTNAQTNNYLQLSAYPSKNSAFEISIEEGVATIEAKESQWDNVLLKFYNYNPNSTTSTYRRFVCIDAASIDAAKHDDVCIYKLEGKKAVVPTADAVISVPKQAVVQVEGVTEATVFEDVKFTYVGSWNIEVSTDAEWLTLNYADGLLKYTATANPGAVRTAKVTITATHEGKEAQEWTFEVIQKGAPTKVTVAEFLAVATDENVNPNVEYEVTGILSSKASSASGSTYLVDAAGNKATFKYVYMPDNTTALSANTEIEVGDIVTIIAAVSDEATGGSSSAHAICKGYYNISATAEKDLVGYAGGSVKLNLAKVGTLNPVADITCSVDANFAQVAYAANAEEATVTLVANDGAPRQVVATFSDGLASTSVTIVQGADTAKGNTWELVTDASTLAVGDQVIVAAATYDVAMGSTISSNDNRPAVEVTKLGNYYLTPNADVQTLVLGKGSVEGTFVFYDAVNEGFLVSSSTSTSSYKLKNQAFIDANTSFAISIADRIATIGNKEGTYSSCKFGYRASTYKYFFSGASTSQEKVCLYRLVGVKGSIPVTPADVTVPTKSVVVPEEGATEATAIDDVKFNYVGEWAISASTEADWITFAFDKATSKLTYTALKNEGVVRETTVTITASLEGQESKSWTFNVLQKGAPIEVSIAEFKTKEVNVNVTYKLTGVITVASTTESGYYTISDGNGNTAEVRYVRTDDGKAVATNDEIGLQVGDVVTVTTVVTTSAGKGGTSAYPTIYKGHYRLTATPSTSLIGYEGGAATIALATEGNLQPADAAIRGAVVEGGDFVTLDYTAGAATATATFAANAGAARSAELSFSYGLASVSLKIGQYNHPDVKIGWFLVTDLSELAVGDKVVIAAKNPDGDKDYAIKKQTSTSPSTISATPISLMGNSISSVEAVDKLTLESGHADCAGTWSFKCENGRYLNVTSGSLKLSSSLAKDGSWAIAIAEDGKVSLTSQTTSSKTTMMFNYTTSNQTFATYAPTQTGKGAIYIYKLYE